MDQEAKKTLFRGSAHLVTSAPEQFDDETRNFRARSNAWVVARPRPKVPREKRGNRDGTLCSSLGGDAMDKTSAVDKTNYILLSLWMWHGFSTEDPRCVETLVRFVTPAVQILFSSVG